VSAQRNETETKQFKTVSKLFENCFVSVSFRCAYSLTATHASISSCVCT